MVKDIFLSQKDTHCLEQLDMCLRNMDAPDGNQVKIWQNL